MRAITIVVELPDELAQEAEELVRDQPTYFANIVEVALRQRAIAIERAARIERERLARILEEDAGRELAVLDEERRLGEAIMDELTPEPLHAHLRRTDPPSPRH